MNNKIFKQLNTQLNSIAEYEQEPVPDSKLKGWKGFIGQYIGENTAGTEFVIGTLFVAHGVSAQALFWGLLAGNTLAVLTWAFLCAPVAVKVRLTLYEKLRRICGSNLTRIYNVVNAVMFCFLAGAMISVSATAVGLPFNIAMPTLNDWLPTGIGWIIAVLIVGSVITVVAILGYDHVQRFANICSPWMVLIFVAAAISVMPELGIHSLSDFWEVAKNKIWTGTPQPGQSKFTFWHIMFFAWFTNLAMHGGMSDLSIFRYAKKWYHGFSVAPGIFLGHMMAWMASGMLTAAAVGAVAPGIIAYQSVGIAGAVAVVIAGWTTANPTIYRAGLAFQAVVPNWKRWKVTLFTGIVTTVFALFPALVMNLLDFVALYGLILMPMGVVILLDVFLFPRIGLKSNLAKVVNLKFNWSAALTWFITLSACLLLFIFGGIEVYFLALPGWFIAAILYIGLSYLFQRKFESEQQRPVQMAENK